VSGVLLASSESLASPLALILIGAAAFTLPLLARRLYVPAIVAEIIFGIIVGPEVLGLIESPSDQDALRLLAELGLLLLMFLAGFEVDFERLERRGVRQIGTALGIYVLILVAAWFGAGLLEPESRNQQVFITLLLSAASVGIVVPALRTTNRTATRLGQLTLITAVVAEFLSLTGIIVLGVWVQEGFGWRLLSVPLLFAAMIGLLLLVRRLAWWHPEWFSRLFSSDDPDELGIRAGLALLFVFAGLSLALGVEGILGAFLAGALFAYVFRDTGVLEKRLAGFAFGFLIPIFFINVGLRFPLSRLTEGDTIYKALLLIVVAILAKVLPSLTLVFQRFTLRESLGAGVLLAGQLSVVIALAELGIDLELIAPNLEAGAILLVAVTAVLSPVAFRLLCPALEPATESAEP
jgi:Kef-type K+ transport system membrane component KefB